MGESWQVWLKNIKACAACKLYNRLVVVYVLQVHDHQTALSPCKVQWFIAANSLV